MRFTVVTLFAGMFEQVLSTSVLGKARAAGLVEIDFVNPRDFATDKHRSVDDSPYGGGPGMVMKCDSLVAAIETAGKSSSPHRVLLSPVGKTLTHSRAVALAKMDHIVVVCGRYEGVDERVVDMGIDESLSIGDYVLTGGELGAMVIIDAVARFVPGVLGHADSADDESFSGGLLEHPQYTRPAEFRGQAVPATLLSGNHAKIDAWRREQSLSRTAMHRPELIRQDTVLTQALAARTYVLLAHHPVLDRNGETVTTSVTNFDIHDIARSCATYGVAGYFPVSPVRLQREKIARIIEIWQREIAQAGSDDRGQALSTVAVSESISSAIETIRRRTKAEPWVVTTSAQAAPGGLHVGYSELVAQRVADGSRPLVLVLGTGWGLHSGILAGADQQLAPIRGTGDFNHLSVRSAASSILDRLFGQ
ncbi:MAG: tRNA (guanosine(37)-N1)-methyltransferase TrmD [Myxococcales bacterium]|nr:tRNA (guanosine(37)-N1)-methyltransferase TrmD [Myxococcales bacterium]